MVMVPDAGRDAFVGSGSCLRGIRLQPDLSEARVWRDPCDGVDMRPRHPLHLSQFEYKGFWRYSLRFCTAARRRHFVVGEAVTLVRSQILRAASERDVSVVAYCFMPDHLHLLVQGATIDADLKRFMGSAKQYSGFHFARRFREPLWQRYGFERVLRSWEPTVTVARYILENPVRAGLADRIEQYPFLGSGVCSLDDLLASIGSGVESG
jgi:putative transposase